MMIRQGIFNLKARKCKQYWKHFFLISAFFMMSPIGIPSVHAQTLELSAVLDSIQYSYPSLKMYDAKIQAEDAAVKGARNWPAPQISAGLWMTPYNTSLWRGTPANNNMPGERGMGSVMIGVEQTFPNKKYNDANEDYKKALSSVTKENKKAAVNNLFATAKKNYYDWIVIEKKLAVLSENEKLLRFMIANAETRYKNGLGKISAYYEAKASLGGIQNTRIKLQNEIEQKKIALNTLMNRKQRQNFTIDTNFVMKSYSKKVFDSTLFYKNRSDIKALDKEIKLTYLKQNLEKQSMKPQFGVSYSHMISYGNGPMMFDIMGTLKIPISWSTKKNKAKIESLKFQAQSMEEQKKTMANDYTGRAYQIQQNIIAKKKQLKLYKHNIIPALQKNYESTQLAYTQNTEELDELYDAWKTLNDTQLEYLNQLKQLFGMQVNLEKLLEIK